MCNNIIQGHAGGKRKKEKRQECEDVTTCRPCDETGSPHSLIEMVFSDLIHQVLGHIQKSGGGKALGKSTEHNIYWVSIHSGSGGGSVTLSDANQ